MNFDVELKKAQATLYQRVLGFVSICVFAAMFSGMIMSRGDLLGYVEIHYPYIICNFLFLFLFAYSMFSDNFVRLKKLFYLAMLFSVTIFYVLSPIYILGYWAFVVLFMFAFFASTSWEFILASVPLLGIFISGNHYYCAVEWSQSYCPQNSISGVTVDYAVALISAWLFVYFILVGKERFYGFVLEHIVLGSDSSTERENVVSRELTSEEKRELEQVSQTIVDLAANSEFYLDPDLSLGKMAKLVSIPTHKLSQALNLGLRVNFYEFVSKHRIDEAKRRLIDPERLGDIVADIAYAVGFNSKSSFYTAFRKATGMTPVEYRQKYSVSTPVRKTESIDE